MTTIMTTQSWLNANTRGSNYAEQSIFSGRRFCTPFPASQSPTTASTRDTTATEPTPTAAGDSQASKRGDSINAYICTTQKIDRETKNITRASFTSLPESRTPGGTLSDTSRPLSETEKGAMSRANELFVSLQETLKSTSSEWAKECHTRGCICPLNRKVIEVFDDKVREGEGKYADIGLGSVTDVIHCRCEPSDDEDADWTLVERS